MHGKAGKTLKFGGVLGFRAYYWAMILLVFTIFLGTAFIFLSRTSHVFKWRVGVVAVVVVVVVRVAMLYLPTRIQIQYRYLWWCFFLVLWCRYHRTLVQIPSRTGTTLRRQAGKIARNRDSKGLAHTQTLLHMV